MFIITVNKRQLGLGAVGVLIACAIAVASLLLGPLSPTQASEEADGVSLPILMYHSVLKDKSRAGKYTVSPDTLEQDMLYLKGRGYTTVVMEDLINYVENGVPLPEKPVMLTFDDGHLNSKTYVYPLLQMHGMKAVISIVGEYTELFSNTPDPNPAYAYLTWDDIREMSGSGVVEFQSHSYALHNEKPRKGAAKKRGEDPAAYQKMLTDDLSKLQDCLTQKSGVTPTTFTYPFGAISKDSTSVVKALGFKASLSCYEKPNCITRDPDCLYELNRYNRANGLSTEKFMKKAGIE